MEPIELLTASGQPLFPGRSGADNLNLPSPLDLPNLNPGAVLPALLEDLTPEWTVTQPKVNRLDPAGLGPVNRVQDASTGWRAGLPGAASLQSGSITPAQTVWNIPGIDSKGLELAGFSPIVGITGEIVGWTAPVSTAHLLQSGSVSPAALSWNVNLPEYSPLNLAGFAPLLGASLPDWTTGAPAARVLDASGFEQIKGAGPAATAAKALWLPLLALLVLFYAAR